MQKSFQLYKQRKNIARNDTIYIPIFKKIFFFCYELFDVSVYCCNLVDSLKEVHQVTLLLFLSRSPQQKFLVDTVLK